MKILLALIFIAFVFQGFDARALQAGRYYMSVHRAKIHDKYYSVVTILSQEDGGLWGMLPSSMDFGDADEEYIESIRLRVQNWIRDRHVDYGTFKKNSALYKDFKDSESLLDDRSTLIFITGENNLNDIKATMRITFRGDKTDNRLHPLEKRLGIKFHDIYREIQLPNGGLAVEGESVEWKNLIKAPGQEIDFISLLFWRALTSGVFNMGYRQIYWKGLLRPLVPKYIIGESKAAMVKFHTRTWGFVATYIKAFQTYFLVAPRTVFMPRLLRNYDHRPGKKLINEENIHEIQFKPVSIPDPPASGNCQSALGAAGPLNFYAPLKTP